MSYRIYVNGYQCLGNNECPTVLLDELKRQGCEIDEDGCFKNFELKELQPIISALEQYIVDTNNWAINESYWKSSIADFTDILEKDKDSGGGLTWRIMEHIEHGYFFITVQFLNAIKDDYEVDYDDVRMIYKIKDGHHVYMSAY